MAAFNPETSVNLGDNYTTRSQGRTPNKALGLLFSSLADGLQAQFKKNKEDKDTALANTIQREVDSIAEGPGDIGGDVVDPIFTDPTKPRQRHFDGPSEGTLEPEVSPGMADAETKLKRLTAAKKQTGMSDVYYNTQVASLLKRLNTMYPGKEAEIAALVTRSTGLSTANKLRQETLALINAEGAADDAEDKRKKQILKENPEALADPYVMTQYEKAAGVPFNPADYNETAFLYAVGTRKVQDASMDRALKEASLEEKGTKRRETKFTKALTEQVQTLSDRLLYTSINEAQDKRGLDPTQTSLDFRNIQDMIKKASDGGTIATPEQMTTIRNQLNMLDVKVSSTLDALINNYATEVPNATDRENIKKLGMAPLQIMKEAFAGPSPNLGIIGAAKAAVENQNDAFVLQNGRFEQRFDMAAKIFGKDNVSALLEKGLRGETLDGKEQAQYNSIKLYLAGGKSLTDLLKQTKENETLTQEEVSKLVPSAVQQHLEMVLQSEDPAAVRKAAKALYGEDERKLLENNAKANPDPIFKMLVSPEMTAKLAGLPEFDDYANFAYYQARPMFKQWVDVAADTQQNTGSGVVTWDEGKGRFSYSLDRSKLPTGSGPGPQMFRDWDLYQADKGRLAVESINSYLDRMQGIFDAKGDTPAGFLQSFFSTQTFNSMKKEGSLLDRMNGSLNNWFKANEEKMRKENPGIENFDIEQQKNAPLGTTPQGSKTKELQGMSNIISSPILNLINKAEGADFNTVFGGGKKDLSSLTIAQVLEQQKTQTKTKGSSATGAFQVMRGTLQSLVKQGVVRLGERFTPELQDRIGHALLERRGYSKYIAGEWDKERFATELAKEWASLPVPKRMKGAHRIVEAGESYYAGDGVNKSTISVQELFKTIDQLTF